MCAGVYRGVWGIEGVYIQMCAGYTGVYGIRRCVGAYIQRCVGVTEVCTGYTGVCTGYTEVCMGYTGMHGIYRGVHGIYRGVQAHCSAAGGFSGPGNGSRSASWRLGQSLGFATQTGVADPTDSEPHGPAVVRGCPGALPQSEDTEMRQTPRF